MTHALVLSLKPFEERCMYILYSVHCTPCSVYRVEEWTDLHKHVNKFYKGPVYEKLLQVW